MTAPTHCEITIRLVSLISLTKKIELSQTKKKILELEKRIDQGALSNVHQYRYKLINSRSKHLKNTIENLRHLELQLKK